MSLCVGLHMLSPVREGFCSHGRGHFGLEDGGGQRGRQGIAEK